MIIEVNGLSKQFRRGGTPTDSFKQAVTSSIKSLFVKENNAEQLFWALQDVSFAVDEGQVLGVIGKNGSGKSTLLKILSKIIRPTKGYVRINGRVSSLLEIGAGFHPDLTGRENIYMNGTLMGMSKKDIERRFDEIISFSGLQKYIDTPVKHYSSGMYMRLGFSTAAHLISDVILIDEVLAVGDSQFQFASLQKIRQLTSEGRTAIIVSHGMNSIINLCTEVILIDKGRMIEKDRPVKVVGTYMSMVNDVLDDELKLNNKYSSRFQIEGQEHLGEVAFRYIEVRAEGKPLGCDLYAYDLITISLEVTVLKPCADTEVMLQIIKNYETQISAIAPNLFNMHPEIAFNEPGDYVLNCTVPKYFFKKGIYTVDIGLKNNSKFFNHTLRTLAFFINLPDLSPKDQWFKDTPFDVGPIFHWTMNKIK